MTNFLKSVKLITVFSIFSLLLLFSCNKEKIVEIQEDENVLFRDGESPSIEDGRLVFSSEESFSNYYESLSLAIENTTDPDDVLSSYESALGFTSLRAATYKEEFTREELVSQFEDEFISDEAFKSILNADYEVEVEGFVHIFLNENLKYKVSKTEPESINLFKSMPKGDDSFIPELNTLAGIYQYPLPPDYKVTIDSIIDPDTDIVTPRTDQYRIRSTLSGNPKSVITLKCNSNRDPDDVGTPPVGSTTRRNLMGVIEKSNDNGATWNTYFGDWTINWGDGETSFESGTGTIDLDHTYSTSEDRYVINIIVDYLHLDFPQSAEASHNVIIRIDNVTVVRQDCQKDRIKDIKATYHSNGKYAMVSKLEYNPSVSSFPVNRSKAKAITRSYEYDERKDYWKRKKFPLRTELNATFRNEECEIRDVDFRTDFSDHASHNDAVARAAANRFISNGDIRSGHRVGPITDVNDFLFTTMVLMPCR